MMGHVDRLVLFAAVVALATFLALNNIGELPERVAIHFDGHGAPDGWTSRENYRVYMLSFLIVAPSLVVWLVAGLPRLTKGAGQIPNAEYWFAPEQRPTTERFLINQGSWLGIMTLAIVFGIHLFVVRANALAPPVLDMGRFVTMLAIYLFGLVWWTTSFLRHFQRMGGHN